MEKEFKICVLAYGKLYAMAKHVIDSFEYEDTELLLCECNVETLSAAVEQAEKQGCEIFVAGAANAAEFSRCSRSHLVEIRMGTVDYLRAIKKAAAIGTRPVIAAYRYSRAVNLPLLEELSDTELQLLQYEDSAELYHGILHTDADVVIGASHAAQIAEELHKNSVLVYFSEDSVRSALRRARLLAQDLQKNARLNRIHQAILNDSPFGLAVSDPEDQVQLMTPAFRRLAGLEGVRLQGHTLTELAPAVASEAFLAGEARQSDQRRLVNGAMLRCVQTRIEERGQPVGVLNILYPDNARRDRGGQSEAPAFRAHYRWKNSIGASPAMQEATRLARQLADLPQPLMITGEAAVGKNFFSQCIHNDSRRAGEPYVTVNLSALPDQDASRVLFGTEDAAGVRPGLFELAQNGTLVLQELGAATPVVQGCILQVLTDRQFRRLGGTAFLPFRARPVTVCEEIDRAQVREDLWQRLSVFRLEVPPLRERTEDIVPSFLWMSQESGRSLRKTSSEFEELLCFYSWPGNLPELSAVCTRYLYFLQQNEKASAGAKQSCLIQAIGEDELLEEFRRRYPALLQPADADAKALSEAVEQMKHLLKYNNEKIAEKLSLSRTTLWRIKKAAEEKT